MCRYFWQNHLTMSLNSPSLSEKVYEQFLIPLVTMIFVKTEDSYLLSSLSPTKYSHLSADERTHSQRIPFRSGILMSRLGIFVDRKTLSNSEQLNALIRCRDVAEGMGHDVEFIFPVDIHKIPNVDALFIRARTDPMNVTYVAARMASFYGIPVIDDPQSIQICSDKVNMYSHLEQKTHFNAKNDFFVKTRSHDRTGHGNFR